jgi:hypothetical protein
VQANLSLAIYGVVLIAAMLIWPSGIQGAVRALARRVRRTPTRPPASADAAEAAS